MRWTWQLRAAGLVLVAAATAVVALGVRPGPQPGQPRAEPSRADRAAAMLADADYPDEYELEAFTGTGLRDDFALDELPTDFGGRDCADIGGLIPTFPADDAGVGASAQVPPGPYEDANWESTDYVEAIGAVRGARWDAARAAEIVDGCGAATTTDGELTITMRRLDPPGPGRSRSASVTGSQTARTSRWPARSCRSAAS